jgi:rhamnogalacturonan endolyase
MRLLKWLVAALAIARLVPAGESRAQVVLQDDGRNVQLYNGIISATISKTGASLSALKFRGYDMLESGYYSMDGGEDYRVPSNCIYKVKIASPDLVDIGMKRIWRNEPQAFDIEIHYVLRRGDSGLYTYALLDHPARYPATGVGEWRMVWKLSNDLLERIYVDQQRNWEMPNSEDYKLARPTPIKEILRIMSGARAGKFDCKYDYSANYWDLDCWGHASNRNRVGGWIVLGSHEFFNDGPTKQDLNAASGINHIHFGMDHYNGSTVHVDAGQAWQKMYGPFLLYCNYAAQGEDACWADAKARGLREKAEWPYVWVTDNPAYPLANDRGWITGRFIVRDPLKPKITGGNAWVGVAQPPPGGNWQFDSMHYQYWAKTDADGSFLIPHVRPGNYTLYAFTDGAVGEAQRQNIAVYPLRGTGVGNLYWYVQHKGRVIAWEIGYPDRTARKFRHGNDYFQGFLWQHFSEEFPNPLVFTIGQSNPATDWNYAQAAYTLTPRPVPHRWSIRFNLDQINPGVATLTLAIASAQRARIDVFVNDERRSFGTVTPSVQGGDALIRESIHAKYCVEYLSIPTDRLRRGLNVISLSLGGTLTFDTHVMYDYLNLELP